MSDNAQKTPLGRSLAHIARNRANDGQQILPKALPCHVTAVNGAIITVAFDLTNNQFTIPEVTMPIFGSRYVRYPLQVGDKGLAISSDHYLGGQSGLGDGTADLSRRSNLSTMTFFPVGQKSFTTVDGNAVVMTAPNGVVLTEDSNNVSATLTPSGFVIKVGGMTATFSATGLTLVGGGGANVSADGHITAGAGGGDSVGLQTHTHPGTLPPTPGT